MNPCLSSLRSAVGVSVLCFCVAFHLPASAQTKEPKAPVAEGKEKPAVKISSIPTNLPPGDGSTDDITGTVTGVKPGDHKVVIYAYGDKWYVQPYAASPLTDIAEDGKWEAKTHGGLEYAVLLVKPSFKPPAQAQSLPSVGGDVLAVAKKKP